MEIIDMIRNDSKDSKWIVDQYRDELLYVDDSFQRRYVWHEKHKIKLIETILLGYAIPEIYIWDVNTDPDTGNTKRSIVDGQQRIGALFSFINNEFKLKKTIIDEKNTSYADKTFSGLSPDDKNKIWKYTFSIRIIKDEVSRDNIVKLFLRLNSTDKSLNPQELRNAEFEGMFLKTAQEIAKYDFWEKHHIFGQDSIRRMGDIEFISSILIFLRMGITSEITQKAINEAYDMFDEKYDEAESDKEIILNILNELDSMIMEEKSILTHLRKTTHLYTIMVVLYKAVSLYGTLADESKNRILDFYRKYDEGCNDEKTIEFKKLISDGTRSKESRIRRTKVLSEIAGL